ncbi:MAG TPA: TadE/TadG family type IV pilus assembly protein [Thermomicrobiales bacterium]|nr:TadE/TadG family type IV pilus assembly protein [Thermomicrobiales bacterium]
MRTIHEHLRPRRGQSVVEFAIISIVILLLTFGIIDLGRGVYQRAMLANAAREAARYASVNNQASDTSGIAAYAAQRSPTLGLTTANFTVTCSRYDYTNNVWSSLSGCIGLMTGDRVQVVATYTFNIAPANLLPLPPIQMSQTAQVGVQ